MNKNICYYIYPGYLRDAHTPKNKPPLMSMPVRACKRATNRSKPLNQKFSMIDLNLSNSVFAGRFLFFKMFIILGALNRT